MPVSSTFSLKPRPSSHSAAQRDLPQLSPYNSSWIALSPGPHCLLPRQIAAFPCRSPTQLLPAGCFGLLVSPHFRCWTLILLVMLPGTQRACAAPHRLPGPLRLANPSLGDLNLQGCGTDGHVNSSLPARVDAVQRVLCKPRLALNLRQPSCLSLRVLKRFDYRCELACLASVSTHVRTNLNKWTL